jgi:hypothetical protein
MSVLGRAIAVLEAASPADLNAMPPAELERFVHLLMWWLLCAQRRRRPDSGSRSPAERTMQHERPFA